MDINFPVNSNNQPDNALMSQYFNSLPPFLKESIMQGGPSFNDIDELKKYVDHFLSHQ